MDGVETITKSESADTVENIPDPYLKVSQSELLEFRECRRRWWLHHIEGWAKPDEQSGALALGTNVHAALCAYYSPGGTPQGAIELLYAIYNESLTACSEWDVNKVQKDFKLAVIMVEGYFAWLEETGADQFLEIIEPESEIEHDIEVQGQTVRILGKRDVIAQDTRTGTATLVDHKGQPYHSLILTPNGWTKMGDLEVGSVVLNHRHQPTTVIGVFELGEPDIYEVRFNDDTTVECTEDHLWENINGKVYELSAWLKNKNIPQFPIVGVDPDYDESRSDLPMDPYSLGCYLGDGSFRRSTPRLHNDDLSMYERLDLTPLCPPNRCMYADVPAWKMPLTELGLEWLRSEDKFIPEKYLFSSATDRLELLRGLMDTDGYVHTSKGNTHFDTSSQALADGVQFLVRSLGGWTTKHTHDTYYVFNGERSELCLPSWRVAVRLPKGICPFWIDRKSDVFHRTRSTKPRKPNKRVTSIDYVGKSPSRCIKVADERQLYITDGYTVTHNTASSFNDPLLDLNEQSRMYLLLQRLNGSTVVQNCLWNLLRKVQRTARAEPPFYKREELYVSEEELRRYYERITGIVGDIIDVRRRLADGERHYSVVYPTPGNDCTWKCPYRVVCPMIDSDPEGAAMYLQDNYIKKDPYSRYERYSDSKGS